MGRRKLSMAWLGCLAAWLGVGTTADASSYYTVTDLGPNWEVSPTLGSNGETSLQSTSTNALIPFSPPAGGSSGGLGNLNTISGLVPNNILFSNTQGDLIAAFPEDAGGTAFFGESFIDFFKKQPDGSYGPGTFLGHGSYMSIFGAYATMNAQDQLMTESSLWNLDTNTRTSFSQLISP